MSKLIVVGGSRGLGFAILKQIHKKYSDIILFDLLPPLEKIEGVTYKKVNLFKDDLKPLENDITSADSLIITAGIGQVKPFSETAIVEIEKNFMVNTVSTIELIKYFYNNLLSLNNKKCLVISSIAGEVSSPLFATYGASKASISKICQSLNIELKKQGSPNRITCIIATSFENTSFNSGKTDVTKLNDLANECIFAMDNKETTHYIDRQKCLDIIQRYQKDEIGFGESSYDYKLSSGRLNHERKYVIGYLSGTFDLFHIGHLNILKRAKEECDYLIVGVHKSGSWKGKETFIPFDERLEIIRSIKYVDEADESFDEDSDAWDKYHFDKLFVGSDYKGSERFKKYELYFKDKGVEIIYFPYTKGTSSTQLREKLSKK